MSIAAKLAGMKYKLIAGVAVAAALAFAGYSLHQMGLTEGRAEAREAIAEYERKVTDLQRDLSEKTTEVSEKIVTEYVDRVVTRERIVYKNNEVIVEVVPDTFKLSKGWVYAYNQTVLGQPIDPDLALDDTESSVSDREGLSLIATNNAICLANTDKLTSLQSWVRETEKVYEQVPRS